VVPELTIEAAEIGSEGTVFGREGRSMGTSPGRQKHLERLRQTNSHGWRAKPVSNGFHLVME